MTMRSTIMLVLASALLVLGGVSAQLGLLPREGVKPMQILRESSRPAGPTRSDIEALLARVGRSLTPDLRAKLADAVVSEASRAGYDPLFVLALVSVESSFRPHVSSERGAAGLMQLKPSTFAWISAREPDLNGDDAAVAEDPVLDVRLAVRYFHWLEKRFDSRDEALMAYNAGPRRIQRYKGRGAIPERLHEYPRRIAREYQRFVRLMGGGYDPNGLLIARAN